MEASVRMPPEYPSGAEMLPGDGHFSCEDPKRRAIAENEIGAGYLLQTETRVPQGEVLHNEALAAIINELVGLQKKRAQSIVSQSKSDRSVESFVARMIGFSTDLDEEARRAVYAKAKAFRKAVEKKIAKEIKSSGTGMNAVFSFADHPLGNSADVIFSSYQSRGAWDRLREQTEKRMRNLVETLPIYTFAKGVAGLGEKGLAIIIGETGDLSGYATKERVWKRLGLAVIDGERQRKRPNAEEAAIHGYNPKRRAEIWTLGDSMFKHQWAGDKDEDGKDPKKTEKPVAAAAHAKGPYGAVYAARKAHTVNRDGWTPSRRDNDARRIMTKALIEDLWRVWRGLEPLQKKRLTRRESKK